MPLKLEKLKNRPFLRSHFAFTLSTLVKNVKVYENDSVLSTTFFGIYTTDTFSKHKRCHMSLKGLSSGCAKLDEILEINVLQKFTPHALWETFGKIEIIGEHLKNAFDLHT